MIDPDLVGRGREPVSITVQSRERGKAERELCATERGRVQKKLKSFESGADLLSRNMSTCRKKDNYDAHK